MALTFDDVTPWYLHRDPGRAAPGRNHATFFPVDAAPGYPELLDRMVAEGHEVANHTWTHRQLSALTDEEMRRGLPALTDEEVRQEIRKVRNLVYLRTGIAPTLLRPPGGTYDSRVLRICADEGFEVCLWTATRATGRNGRQRAARKGAGPYSAGRHRPLHDESMERPKPCRTSSTSCAPEATTSLPPPSCAAPRLPPSSIPCPTCARTSRSCPVRPRVAVCSLTDWDHHRCCPPPV